MLTDLCLSCSTVLEPSHSRAKSYLALHAHYGRIGMAPTREVSLLHFPPFEDRVT
ncbi:hypothetical protein M404DRAFT_998836 [Pisolithus tinctorius Marx 270]|uniref:Uncharacterized protein n=1 Tax=Pisolithus tinctorius Marx 270 TaxID=870435 RepID=A0A0C3P0S8_PISTI|nr:hypothetical protein M404DRAFT_998836 [Pisolithus tinctorius Marx 270]